MIAPFDLIRIKTDGSVKWLGVCVDLDAAKLRVRDLSATIPAEYFIFSQTTGRSRPGTCKKTQGTAREPEDCLRVRISGIQQGLERFPRRRVLPSKAILARCARWQTERSTKKQQLQIENLLIAPPVALRDSNDFFRLIATLSIAMTTIPGLLLFGGIPGRVTLLAASRVQYHLQAPKARSIF